MKYILKNEFNLKPGAYIDYLNNIGITQVDSFLCKPRGSDYISPFKLDNMKELIECLHNGFINNKSFFIQVDPDVDGFTSSAIFYNYFISLYPDSKMTYRLQDNKEHGIIINTIPVDTDIVIVPDAGSNQIDEFEQIAATGRKVLCMDHHLVETTIDIPNVIIVNNQVSGRFINKSLSGAGVVYKVIQAYDETYEDGSHYKKYEDLAALGIISDNMDTRPLDNNAIIMNGLSHINNTLFKELLSTGYANKNKKSKIAFDDMTIDMKLNICNKIGIAFYIAPLINAVIRTGSMENKLEFFNGFLMDNSNKTTTTVYRGATRTESIYQYLVRTATNLRATQNRNKLKSMNTITQMVDTNNLNTHKILIIQVDKDIVSLNNTGLVAMDCANTYNKPCLVVRPVTVNNNIYYRGSGRSAVFEGFTSFINVLRESGLVEYAQGHDNAFGVSIEEQNVQPLLKYLDTSLSNIDFTKYNEINCIVDSSNWDVVALKEFAHINNIYGCGIVEPRFLFDITIEGENIIVDSKYIKFYYKGISFIMFYPTDNIAHLLSSSSTYHISLIGKVSINNYLGYQNLQVTMSSELFEFEPVKSENDSMMLF